MTNFDFLKKEPKFNSFSDVAIAAEKILKIDKESSVINCRRAMEFAIKWMYSVDKSLEMPYQDKLISLMSTEDFHDIVDDALWKRLDLIRKIGNRAAHNGRKITEDEAILCLQNLFIFMDYVSYCYSDFYEERKYDVNLLTETQEESVVVKTSDNDVDLQALIALCFWMPDGQKEKTGLMKLNFRECLTNQSWVLLIMFFMMICIVPLL